MAKIYGDRWQIEEHLDRGGQGEVFLVRDLNEPDQERRALKRVLNPKRRERFAREVQACTLLSHPGVMRILDHSALKAEGAEESKMYLVMPLAAGGSLEARAGLYKDSIDPTLHVALGVARALEHAHSKGVIHRDVKPANILFWQQDHDSVLSDFGICLIRDQHRITEADEVAGPWAFMAPEVEGGGKLDVTPAADVYSLGKVIYYMLSGGIVLPRERQNDPEYDRLPRGRHVSAADRPSRSV